MVAIAASRNIIPVLMTFALSPEWFPDQASCQDIRTTTVDGIDEMNAVIRRVAQESGALLFDLAQVMPKDKRYFEDFCHNNEEGAKFKANLVADFIVSKKEGALPRL